jgi:hypothetical protein
LSIFVVLIEVGIRILRAISLFRVGILPLIISALKILFGFGKHGIHAREHLFSVSGNGNFFAKDLGKASSEYLHLLVRYRIRVSIAVQIGIAAFQEPGGSSPKAGVSAGIMQIVKMVDFGGRFSFLQFRREFWVSQGRVVNGLQIASHVGSGGSAWATKG